MIRAISNFQTNYNNVNFTASPASKLAKAGESLVTQAPPARPVRLFGTCPDPIGEFLKKPAPDVTESEVEFMELAGRLNYGGQ